MGWIPAFAGMTTGGAAIGRRYISLRNISNSFGLVQTQARQIRNLPCLLGFV